MSTFKQIVIASILILSTTSLFAQGKYSVKIKLLDSLTNKPIEFATVYISSDGSIKNALYSLSDADGVATIKGVKRGKYVIKAELMGYKIHSKSVEVDKENVDLGSVKMVEDVTALEQATISDVGASVVVKKDTIEYNAKAYKIGENDVLEDLLKKLPGIEVDSEGKVTAKGKEIKKITIDGKTFFLNDPKVATKNLPANIVEKVKVIDKKSDEALFTGIDDGNEETIIDIKVSPGMMKGWIGNMSAAGGVDLVENDYDARYYGNVFAGHFTDDRQIAILGGGNNTNNTGFTNTMGSTLYSMRANAGRRSGMRSTGGGDVASWNGGGSFSDSFFKDDALNFSGSYLYNGSDSDSRSSSVKENFLTDGSSLITINNEQDLSFTNGNSFGVDTYWTVSDRTSLSFRPSFTLGNSSFSETNDFSSENSATGRVNDGSSSSNGNNNSLSANGNFTFRQKIGKTQGRSLTFSLNYGITKNSMDGFNKSVTNNYRNDVLVNTTEVDQQYFSNNTSSNFNGRASYTEPLGKRLFAQASYSANYSQSEAEKKSYNKDNNGEYTIVDGTYSNKYKNSFLNQDIQVMLMHQGDKLKIQAGFGVQPQTTTSVKRLFSENKDSILTYSVVNYSPNAQITYTLKQGKKIDINYRGRTTQPTITQLQPVPDNSNPLYIRLGNPTLQPEFSNNVNVSGMFNNNSIFSFLMIRLSFDYVKDDIINAVWYNSSGVQRTAPINASEPTFNGDASVLYNSPIAKSKFRVSNSTSFSINSGLSYTGTGDYESIDEIQDLLLVGRTTSLTARESLSFSYNDDNIGVSIGASTSYRNAFYTIKEQEKPSTWTNSATASVNATIPGGIAIKTNFAYTFYKGFEDGYNTPEALWNAEISKTIFKKRANLNLKVYDILNQAKSINRYTTDNYVQDVRTNTLGRYVLFGITFQFGTFNRKRGRHDRGGERGPHIMRGSYMMGDSYMM